MRFTHLRLENWRSFVEVDTGLAERVFLVGANASGKSNLLDVFRFLRDIAAPDGGLRTAAEKPHRRGIRALRSVYARRNPHVVIEVEIGDDTATRWTYRLELAEHRGHAAVGAESVRRGQETILERPDAEDRADPDRLTQTHLEQVSANKEFRDLADFLAGVTYLHIVPQLIREPDRLQSRHGDPYGSDFIRRIAETHHQTRAARLRRITRVLQPALANLQELELYQDERGAPHLRGRYENWRRHGVWQTEEQFSDGTLRLIGLLWSLLDGDGPLLLEEPELSMHPALVRQLVPMMSSLRRLNRQPDRQLLVSTHSRDLLLDPGIASDEILLLEPAGEGTRVRSGAADPQLRLLLEGGLAAGDAALPRVAPPEIGQLANLTAPGE